MSTITLDIAPEVIEKAEDVFKRKGMSYSQFLRDITEKAIMDLSDPEELPVPCIDDLTEEELDDMIQKSLDKIEAGHYYTSEEMIERIKRYGVDL